MIRIELNNVDDNKIKTKITVEGKKSDILPEVLFFHADHVNMLKAITDKLPLDLQLKARHGIICDIMDVIDKRSDEE